MSWTDVFAAIAAVLGVLESLGVRYRIGGSVASLNHIAVGRSPLEANVRAYDLTTAEDIVLHELACDRDGDRISERPWRDVIGVLHVQRGVLDLAYLRHWAGQLGVGELLEQAPVVAS